MFTFLYYPIDHNAIFVFVLNSISYITSPEVKKIKDVQFVFLYYLSRVRKERCSFCTILCMYHHASFVLNCFFSQTKKPMYYKWALFQSTEYLFLCKKEVCFHIPHKINLLEQIILFYFLRTLFPILFKNKRMIPIYKWVLSLFSDIFYFDS